MCNVVKDQEVSNRLKKHILRKIYKDIESKRSPNVYETFIEELLKGGRTVNKFMSKAGQNTFTGISFQADIALLYLIENYYKGDFIEIILEGEHWEDFTLIFNQKTDSYEVKWHQNITYYDVQEIIKKEIEKKCTGNYQFTILCKKISKKLSEDHSYLKKMRLYWETFNRESGLNYDPNDLVIKRFIKKGWTNDEILFFMRIKIVEFCTEEDINNRIIDYFVSKEIFYYGDIDVRNIVSSAFNKIVKASMVGGYISKEDFVKFLEAQRVNITDKSESFPSEMRIGKLQLDPFLENAGTFITLDHAKYLSPLSFRPRIVFAISERIHDPKFSARDILFFLEKILIKRSYHVACLDLLRTKHKQGKLNKRLFLNFINKNYQYFKDSHIIESVLSLLLNILNHESSDAGYWVSVLKFLKKYLMIPIENVFKNSVRNELDYSYTYRSLPEIIKKISIALPNSESFLDLMFDYFDFTAKDFDLNTDTPSQYFIWIKDYIKQAPEKRIPLVVEKIKKQFTRKYGRFDGAEPMGGVVQMIGNEYDIRDKGIVVLIFEPLFIELYKENKSKTWRLIKKSVLIWPNKKETSNEHPALLKRAVIKILIERSSDARLSEAQKKKHIII